MKTFKSKLYDNREISYLAGLGLEIDSDALVIIVSLDQHGVSAAKYLAEALCLYKYKLKGKESSLKAKIELIPYYKFLYVSCGLLPKYPTSKILHAIYQKLIKRSNSLHPKYEIAALPISQAIKQRTLSYISAFEVVSEKLARGKE